MTSQYINPTALRLLAVIISIVLLYLPVRLAPEEIRNIPKEIDFSDVESGIKSILLLIVGFAFLLLLFSFMWIGLLKVLIGLLLVDHNQNMGILSNALYLTVVSLLLVIILYSHHTEVIERPELGSYGEVDQEN